MGKRVKKKSHAPHKDKRVVGHSPKIAPQQSNLSVDTIDGGGTALKERKQCNHLDKGFDLKKLSGKIGSSDPVRCEDCREGGADRRGAKGKGKQGKKKGSASVDSKSDSKAIWVCLECGHYACGGIGLPTTPQSHAVRHARQTRHPLVVQWENPHLRWCFKCNTLIPVEKTEENGEKKDALLDVVKLIKGPPSEQSLVDVQDVWFGSGSVASEIKAEVTVSSSLEGRGGYMVRGLVNLGNTCFFNSVMQNLLAMHRLRDYFFDQDASFGPLSIALKKLFTETKPETGLKNVINPRSFFGCVCSKAPQFRGYQQQDSHELLRCLLDGLSTEELAARKQINASEEDGITPKHSPTFVEAAFGGQISSTVCCVECGHFSTVYEPFLDLSLPVPTKKPPTKKAQPSSRAKKTKLPPKRGVRTRPKANKDADSAPAQSFSNPLVSSVLPCQTQSTIPLAENMVASSGNTPLSDAIGPTTAADVSGLVSQNFSAVPKSENEQVVEATMEQTDASFDNFWMDYIGPETMSDGHDFTPQNNDISASQHFGDKDLVPNDGLMDTSQVCLVDGEPNQKLDSSSVNSWEEEVPLQVQSSEVLLLPYQEESFTNRENMGGEAEASSSVVGCGQDEVDFDGFGDLFNEPEVSVGPVTGPSLGNEVAGTGFMAGNGSDSDPDEVDNTDSPVSVESCLAHFIKPELLSNDNAWECENCSKTLQRQMLEAKKKQAKTALETMINGGENKKQSNPLSLCKDISCSAEVRNLSNGDINNDNSLNSIGESLVSNNEKMDYSDKICIKTESGQSGDPKPFVSQGEEQKVDMNAALIERSNCSGHYESCCGESLIGPGIDSCSVDESNGAGYTTAKDEQSDSQFSGNCESEVNEDENKTLKKVNVKSDATKRVLIDKAPPILTIHLKRFSQDARGRLSKLTGHVNFGDTLDLRPYMDPRYLFNTI